MSKNKKCREKDGLPLPEDGGRDGVLGSGTEEVGNYAERGNEWDMGGERLGWVFQRS